MFVGKEIYSEPSWKYWTTLWLGMKQMLWSLKTEGSPNFWKIKDISNHSLLFGVTLGQTWLQWPTSPLAKGTALRLLDQCHGHLFPVARLGREGRGRIYEVCRCRNGRMKRCSLVPSRNKVSKCTVQPLAGSAREMQVMEAAACGTALSAEHWGSAWAFPCLCVG